MNVAFSTKMTHGSLLTLVSRVIPIQAGVRRPSLPAGASDRL